MRGAHGIKPSRAVVRAPGRWYVAAMKSTTRLQRGLRFTAVLIFAATAITWLATGAHRGWSRTSTVTMQRDEITGIDYPVEQANFVAGVEVLAAGVGLAVLLGGASLLVRARAAGA